MNEKKDRKELIITGHMVARFAFILTIVAVIVFVIVTLVRGTPVVELFTDHLGIWGGFVVSVLGLLFTGDKKASESKAKD